MINLLDWSISEWIHYVFIRGTILLLFICQASAPLFIHWNIILFAIDLALRSRIHLRVSLHDKAVLSRTLLCRQTPCVLTSALLGGSLGPLGDWSSSLERGSRSKFGHLKNILFGVLVLEIIELKVCLWLWELILLVMLFLIGICNILIGRFLLDTWRQSSDLLLIQNCLVLRWKLLIIRLEIKHLLLLRIILILCFFIIW
jgi:hypothetical protein